MHREMDDEIKASQIHPATGDDSQAVTQHHGLVSSFVSQEKTFRLEGFK